MGGNLKTLIPRTILALAFYMLCSFFTPSHLNLDLMAAVPSGYSNGSSLSSIDYSEIIRYINSKNSIMSSTKFISNTDKIYYYESFFDTERDYDGLSFTKRLLMNTALTEQEKKLNSVGIKLFLTHEPTVYDNAVDVHPISGTWYDATIIYNATVSKWEIVCSELFSLPLDTHRGKWTLCLSGTDSTGKVNFDERSYGYGSFNVHKAPIPKMNVTSNGTTLTMCDQNSFDYDYQYSKPNNGIAKYEWEVKVNGSWVSAGTGPIVYYGISGKTVTDYRLTVTDYDGAKASVTKSAPTLEKPVADFYYQVGGKTVYYAYYGNVGNESLAVKDSINWYDDGYVSTVHTTTGTRTTLYKAIKTGTTNATASGFSGVLKNNFTSLINSKAISSSLTVKNKYDIQDSVTKNIATRQITSTQKATPEVAVNGSAVPGTNILIDYILTSTGFNMDDLRIVCSSPLWTAFDITLGTDFKSSTTLKLPDYSKTGNSSYFDIDIYSRRDGSKLHSNRTNLSFIIPLELDYVGTQWFIPGDRVNVNLKSNQYVNSVVVTLFTGTSYQVSNIPATLSKTEGGYKYWTISYVPPADIPLVTYQTTAVGTGIGGLTINASAPLHFISLNGEVTHTDEWELNRQKYNTSKTGTATSPRTKDLFFNGEKFMLNSSLNTSITSGLTINSITVELVNSSYGTTLNKANSTYTGNIFNSSFKTLWQVPDVYDLVFKFNASIVDIGDVSTLVKVKVDSTDVYWRDHLKD